MPSFIEILSNNYRYRPTITIIDRSLIVLSIISLAGSSDLALWNWLDRDDGALISPKKCRSASLHLPTISKSSTFSS
jgi:hypothetical protein